MTKCASCPAHGLPGTCPGEWSRGACRLPGLDARYAAVFVAAAGGEPYVEPARTVPPWNPGTPPGPGPGGWEPSADAPPPPAPIDPLSVAVDTCAFRGSCQCGGVFRCLLAGLPALVTVGRDCRRCPVAAEIMAEGGGIRGAAE